MALDPNYIVGFVDGEGCFCITRDKSSYRLLFEIELRENDKPILEAIQSTLGCGQIYYLEYERYAKWQPHIKLKVSNFRDIYTKVIPFFKRYPLQAKKRFDFQKFCEVAELFASKEHLTSAGRERIEAIKHRDSLDALDAHVQLRREKSGGRQ